jgi:hypothetical protein
MIQTGKIINDPVHGFITVPRGLILSLTQHPWFQRLRDIKQLGLTNLVYPGAVHTRLSHALGAMHLMNEAITSLESKGAVITPAEKESAMAAILLHDIGHGPFSHALEGKIVRTHSHEEISLLLMKRLNEETGGKLSESIEIFTGNHPKKFLHQLVSSQLDVDRLDYLRRDSFFSGVAEGMIGLERIIKMMIVSNNELVIEQKGIYSIEKFLISRRLMYWQVYFHKTVIAAEQLLIEIIARAGELLSNGMQLPGSPALLWFLNKNNSNIPEKQLIENFVMLDDSDVLSAVKLWQNCGDELLSKYSYMLVTRNLPGIILSDTPFGEESAKLPGYISRGEVENKGYDSVSEEIKILDKTGKISDIYNISDMLSARAFSQITKKYFLCTSK